MNTNRENFDCAIIGNWHLAFVTASALSSLGHKVRLLHPGAKAERWDSLPQLDLVEPNVNEIIEKCHQQGTFSYGHYQDEDWEADFVWLAVDTHVREDDTCDTSEIENILNTLVTNTVKKSLVVTSQVPLGFCQKYKKTFPTISYIPENLQLGKGLETFLNSDRLVIGSDSLPVREELKNLLKDVKGEVFECDLNTSEMIKHATNIFLATSISLANQLAMIGEKYNVDNHLVGKALKADPRIGKRAYIIPGTGFAGGTLPRDLKILQGLGKELNVDTDLVDSVLKINNSTNTSIVNNLISQLSGLENKKILLMGYSYKKDIDTLRRSPAVTLAKLLKDKNAVIFGFDPIMNDKNLSELDGLINHSPSIEELPKDLDAIVITTPRDSFKELTWSNIFSKEHSTFLFDLNGIIDSSHISCSNFSHKILWQPVQTFNLNEER